MRTLCCGLQRTVGCEGLLSSTPALCLQRSVAALALLRQTLSQQHDSTASLVQLTFPAHMLSWTSCIRCIM